MYTYHIYEDPSEESVLRYGIELSMDNKPVNIIGDISDSKSEIGSLVKLFNQEELDPIHFEQAIEDYLTDFSV